MSGGLDVFRGDFNFDVGENLELVVDGFVIIFQSVEVGVTKEDSLEFIVGGFRISERGSESEEVVVGLEIGLFESGSEKVWMITIRGSKILLDSFKIRVTS